MGISRAREGSRSSNTLKRIFICKSFKHEAITVTKEFFYACFTVFHLLVDVAAIMCVIHLFAHPSSDLMLDS